MEDRWKEGKDRQMRRNGVRSYLSLATWNANNCLFLLFSSKSSIPFFILPRNSKPRKKWIYEWPHLFRHSKFLLLKSDMSLTLTNQAPWFFQAPSFAWLPFLWPLHPFWNKKIPLNLLCVGQSLLQFTTFLILTTVGFTTDHNCLYYHSFPSSITLLHWFPDTLSLKWPRTNWMREPLAQTQAGP